MTLYEAKSNDDWSMFMRQVAGTVRHRTYYMFSCHDTGVQCLCHL